MHYVVKNTKLRDNIPSHSGESAHYYTIEHGRYDVKQGEIIKKHLSINAAERQASLLNNIVMNRDTVRDSGRKMYYVIQGRANLKEGGTEKYFYTAEYREYKGSDSAIVLTLSTLREAEDKAEMFKDELERSKLKRRKIKI